MGTAGNISRQEISPLRIESINLGIFLRLLSRNLRYLAVILPLYGRSLIRFTRSHHLRTAYRFARYVDDLLDGDQPVPGNIPPQLFVKRLMSRIARREPAVDTTHLLGTYLFENIDRYATPEVRPSCELNILVQCMLLDRLRREHRLLMPAPVLLNHHLETFCSALHITLCISGVEYTTAQILSLARAQASFYTLRDLKEDLQNGIHNIPEDVLEESGLTEHQYWNYSDLRQSPVVRQWMVSELEAGRWHLTHMKEISGSHPDRIFGITVRPLLRGLSYLSVQMESRLGLINHYWEKSSYAH